jgi:membrane-associated phospholipid phosphatase
MKFLSFLILLSFLKPATALHAQTDSLPHAKILLLPAALIAYGVLSQASPALKDFDRYINRTAPHTRIKIDDYIQYAPAIAVYGLDFAGIKARHNLRDRTFVMLSSHLLMNLSVHATKYALDVRRPDGSGNNSFPSGHTALAFTGAHILFREYHHASPLISLAGYATATATGLLRIVNEKHWLSDVAAGAGVAILSVEIGYRLLPVFRRVTGKRQDIAIVPFAGNNTYGLSLTGRF